MSQQYVVYVVHYKESADSIQWDKDFTSKKEAEAFVAEVEEGGGIAIIVEDVREDNDTIIGTDTQIKNELFGKEQGED